MATSKTYKESVEYVSRYVGTGHSDTLTAYSETHLHGLQGDDVLSPSSYGYSGSTLIGGSGNDTYINTNNMFVYDLGGGNDKIVLSGLSSKTFENYNFYTAVIDNKHISITDGRYVIYVLDYKTEASKIETVEFNDGVTMSFDAVINKIAQKSGYLGNYSWYELFKQAGITDSAYALQVQKILSGIPALNRKYESEADFSRDATADDVQSIARLFKTALDRSPDQAGLNSWVDKWEENWSEADIAKALIDSDEFKSVYGEDSSNDAFVNALYENAFGRAPDQAGFDSWKRQLDSNQVSREDAILLFSSSDENKSRTSELFGSMKESSGEWSYGRNADADDAAQIARLYKASFNRTPDNAGLNHWIDQWESGLDLDDIAEAFMSSTEFTNLYSTVSADADFVNLLYQNALGRTADDGGRAHWTQQMQFGLSREDLLLSFSDSTENQANTGYQMRSAGDDWFFN